MVGLAGGMRCKAERLIISSGSLPVTKLRNIPPSTKGLSVPEFVYNFKRIVGRQGFCPDRFSKMI